METYLTIGECDRLRKKVTPGYGFRLLNTGETRLSGDQFTWDAGETWQEFPKALGHYGNVDAAHTAPTRRKIDPGSGFEIVPLDDPTEGADVYRDGEGWQASFWHDRHDGQTPRQAVETWKKCGGMTQLTFRRPIKQVVAELDEPEAPASQNHFIICQQRPTEGYGYIAAHYPWLHKEEWKARAEAARLAKAHGGKFVVFKAIAAYEAETVRLVKPTEI